MTRLRHPAPQVPDVEKSVRFFEPAFGLKRVCEVESPIGVAEIEHKDNHRIVFDISERDRIQACET